MNASLLGLLFLWFLFGFLVARLLGRREPSPDDASVFRPDDDHISRTAPLPPLEVGAVYSSGFDQATVLDLTPWRVIVANNRGGVRGWTIDEFRRTYPHRLTKGEGS